MCSFFKKKPDQRATAVLLESGREVAEQAMRSPKFNDYRGPEPMFPMRVRVTDDTGRSWDATMKAGPTTAFLLLPGVRVPVKYAAGDADEVLLDADAMQILAANPQLKRNG